MAFIKHIAYYLPEKVITSDELVEFFGDESLKQVAKSLGVESRHVAAEGETSGDMAVKAAQKLFEENNIDRNDVDFVLLCTQQSEYYAPSTSCIVQDRLHLRTDIGAFTFDLGCSGFVYGLAIASSFIKSGLAKNVLLLTSDTTTRVLPSDDKNRLLFGDGAAATLISNEGIAEIGKFDLGTDGSGFDKLIIKNGGFRNPQKNNTQDDWMYMDGEAIFNFTVDCVPQLIQKTVELNHLEKNDVNYFVFHQANQFMLNTLRKICGIGKSAFFVDMSDTGNTTSSSVPIGLSKSLINGSITKGMNVMVAGFGVGLSWAGTILKF